MSLFSVFQVSGSALNAQAQRLNVVASNLANVDSVTGPDGKPYVAKQVVFEVKPQSDVLGASGIGGVSVAKVVDDPSPMRTVFDPQNPAANKEGYVTYPNVNPVNETVNMISASRSYQANVEVLNTTKTLLQKTLTLGQ